MDRIRNFLKMLLERESLPEAPPPQPRVRPHRPSVGALLFRAEPLPTDEPLPPKPAKYHVGRALFGHDELSVEPEPPPAPKRAVRGLWHLLFAVDELAEEPQAKPERQASPGVWRTLFAIDALETRPVEAPHRRRPFLRWLLWPESLSSDQKKTGEN